MIEKNNFLVASSDIIEKINSIEEKVDKLFACMSKSGTDLETYLTGAEARQFLGVSTSTWQLIRDQKRLPFSQIGRKIYVKKSDLIQYMNSHIIQ